MHSLIVSESKFLLNKNTVCAHQFDILTVHHDQKIKLLIYCNACGTGTTKFCCCKKYTRTS